jgi:HSP20 family molecular chaperone IbpA
MAPTDIEAKPKQKLERREESTRPGAYFHTPVDIYETPEELVVTADMPGVSRENVDIQLDGDSLTIEGRVRPEDYEGLKPAQVEYGVGGFYRRFSVGEAIDREGIKAQLTRGVLTLRLPKAAHARQRRIEVQAA